MKLQETIPFDQYSRQMLVKDMLKVVRGSKPLKILDIGGYKGNTNLFLDKDKVTVVDLYDVSEKNYVKASGTKLPFDDGEFDFCLSFDVLEHVTEKERRPFIEEALRVAQKGVIICAPHNTPQNESAEKYLNEYYQSLYDKQHDWLHEHIEYKIPDFQALSKLFKQYNPQIYYSNDTTTWMLMQGMLFINEGNSWAAEKLIEINSFINNKVVYESGSTPEESYRAIFCLFKDKKAAKTISDEFEVTSMSSEDKATIVAMTQDYYRLLLKNNLIHSNSDLTLVTAERNKLLTENAKLSQEMNLIKQSRAWKLLRRAKGK